MLLQCLHTPGSKLARQQFIITLLSKTRHMQAAAQQTYALALKVRNAAEYKWGQQLRHKSIGMMLQGIQLARDMYTAAA